MIAHHIPVMKAEVGLRERSEDEGASLLGEDGSECRASASIH